MEERERLPLQCRRVDRTLSVSIAGMFKVAELTFVSPSAVPFFGELAS